MIIESSADGAAGGIPTTGASGVYEVGVIVDVGVGGGGVGAVVSTGTPGAAGKDDGAEVAVGVVFVFDGVGNFSSILF